MGFCTNCGAALSEGLKFCTHCGHPVSGEEQPAKRSEYTITDDTVSNKSGRNKTPIYIALILLIGLAYVGFQYLDFDNNLSEKPISSIDISGEYYDPSGAFLGSADKIISVSKTKDIYIGENKSSDLKITFTPMGSNNFSAEVILNRVPGDFEVHFYEDEGKLTFFNSLTKSSWYLLKT